MFKRYMASWIERYLFFPNILQQLISIVLLPLTLIYCLIVSVKRTTAKPRFYGIPVVGIGNLLVGGTGKTPVTIALAKERENIAVVLRGYGRVSKGMIVISKQGEILVDDVNQSGDEAMLLAKSLPNATIIVAENRVDGILKAKQLGAQAVFLDDAFSKYDIVKYDILIRPKKEPTNVFCLPSGGYREPKIMYATANQVLVEDKDFKRVVTIKKDGQIIEDLPKSFVLITAISKADRLLEYIPDDTSLEAFADHHMFTKNDIQKIKEKYPHSSIITTSKDMVKLEQFNLDNVYVLDLEIEFDKFVDFTALNKYLEKQNSAPGTNTDTNT